MLRGKSHGNIFYRKVLLKILGIRSSHWQWNERRSTEGSEISRVIREGIMPITCRENPLPPIFFRFQARSMYPQHFISPSDVNGQEPPVYGSLFLIFSSNPYN